MLLEDKMMEEYPFRGAFYRTRMVGSGSLLDRETVTEEVLEVDCDIQQASILGNAGFKTTTYNVYFPLREKGEWESVREKFEPIIARRGMFFKGEALGYEVDGVVEGIGFSQLGGCVAQIKDRTE